MDDLGMLYLKGEGVKQNKVTAFELFKKAALLGDAAAQINVALMYAWGRGSLTTRSKPTKT